MVNGQKQKMYLETAMRTKNVDFSGMKIWVTLQDKMPLHPKKGKMPSAAQVVARGEKNLEWTGEEGDESGLQPC